MAHPHPEIPKVPPQDQKTSMKSIGSSRVGNDVTFCLPGVGNRPPKKKKIENPWGCARGGRDGYKSN